MAQVLYKNFEIQLILALTVSITACTNTDLMHTTAIDTVLEETALVKAKPIAIEKSNINFDSHPIAKRYRTVISGEYAKQDVNFANHYVVITWGCGSGCVSGAMVDSRNGTVYPLPEDKEWGGNGTYVTFEQESNILTSVWVIPTPTGDTEETQKYWKWDEQSKVFAHISALPTYLESK